MGSGGTGYTYDVNGNLKTDSYKSITNIAYNHLNLPNLVTFSSGNSIEFVYDATGMKLRKIVKVGATVQYEQDYAGGIEYRKVGTNSKRVETIYHNEGRFYNLNVETSNTLLWRKEYALRDHLGNTRLMFADKNANGVIDITNTPATNDILQENHYYPFGFGYEGPWLMNDAARDNKYQYNDKELNDDFGLNWYDYGARWYMPDIGRFGSIDPLAGSMAAWSPYSYGFNNPLKFTDPTGMAPFDDHYISRDGKITTVQTDDDFDRFYVQQCQNDCGEYEYTQAALLEKNDAGLVKFPASGNGFDRYGTEDAGGFDPKTGETRGEGDHFVKPETAAALLGVTTELADEGITLSLGDMSSSNGSDPGNPNTIHHGGHGHNGNRSGLDADFRYVDGDGNSFQSQTATTDKQFSTGNNSTIYNAATKYGFTKNYNGTNGPNLPNSSPAGGHNDHGHLGLNYKNLNWVYARNAPRN